MQTDTLELFQCVGPTKFYLECTVMLIAKFY